jgi:3-oxoacyl-[acyl-carrier protein] reductase
VDLELADRTFVVGGASRGLGRAICSQLVAEGARVIGLSRSGEAGEGVVPLAADMAAPDSAARVRDAVEDQFGGRLDGVVVNHGGPRPGPALTLSDEDWRAAFELVIGGPLRLLRELEPLIGDGGAILFVTSSSVRQPIGGLDTSNVLRPGVAALAKVLARELGPRIRVNSIAPGRFDTDRVRSMDADRSERSGTGVEDIRRAAEDAIPLGRYGDPAELARVAAFLLAPAASYLSGAAVQVDGAAVTAVP